MLGAVERVRGFYDMQPGDRARWSAALQQMVEGFERHDFAMIDLPIVELLDLYLRKNGAQVLSKLYTFTDNGKREVALRPEFTASVIRAFAPQVQSGRAPLRLAYAGPVFRYEKPQRATMRQFTQVGVEILGDASAAADASLLALACEAARDLGISRMRLVIGHLGPLRALLTHLQVHGYTEDYLLEHLEFYNRGPAQRLAVRRRLGVDADGGSLDDASALQEGLAAAVHDLDQDRARAVVSAVLRQTGFELSGSTRPPEEIIDALLVKARRQDDLQSGVRRANVARALDFLDRLSALRGAPGAVIPEAERLLAEYEVPATTLGDLGEILERLESYDLSGVTVEVAPGMARGIAYYSGLIFELYAGDTSPDGRGPDLQICGGGRYDGLARAITGKAGFPALGFAFGLERVLHALPEHLPMVGVRPRVALILGDGGGRSTAQLLARLIRAEGMACAVLEAGADRARALDQARRAGYWAAITLGGAGANPDAGHPVVWRDDEGLHLVLSRVLASVQAPSSPSAPAVEVR